MTASASPTTSLTSFAQLFDREINNQIIQEIEIPLIQRDYAQGRETETVKRIREKFIDALYKALLPDSAPIDLDFVFGDVNKLGKFYPLDGQQRLTTLFLLHCYLAWRINSPFQDQAWTKFSYATRPSARDFCAFLVSCQPDFSEQLSLWLKDESDYLPTWQYDPTIQSMLVVLDSLHGQFEKVEQSDIKIAWNRLIDKENPAIRFHILPMEANKLTDDLYIKMNSRGKPLTEFENFKAHFEDVLTKSHPEQASEFAKKVDTDWSDILWTYRGEDNLIDDEFMRYFRFVTEVCAWNAGIEFDSTIRHDDLAEKVYSGSALKAVENLKFLFDAFDIWNGKIVKDEFEKILTTQSAGTSTPLCMFNSFDEEGVDLFHACCRHYREETRKWSLAHTLLLYAVLLKFIHKIEESDFSKRLRIVRNLVQASSDEIREEKNRNNMPNLLADVVQIIVHDDLSKVGTFNKAQIENEKNKATMLASMPTFEESLHTLEDHDLLRGGLTVFDFDNTKFKQRAETFITMFGSPPYDSFKLITGALLATGDYSRKEPRFANFGAPKRVDVWRELFRGKTKESTHPVSIPLMALLDTVAAGTSLQGVINAYINNPSTLKDWRYYFVKYETMREGASGRYTISSSGYQVCMLNKERMSSYYHDAYLLAMVKQSAIPKNKIANQDCVFYGYETNPRKLILNSGLEIQCVDKGWEITNVPTEPTQQAILTNICTGYGISSTGSSYLYEIDQVNGIDTEDRIEKAALLLADLVNKCNDLQSKTHESAISVIFDSN